MKFHSHRLTLPHIIGFKGLDGFLTEARHLSFILGLALVVLGALVFSIWRDHLMALKDEDRAKFLMFNLKGGSWVVAVFAFCGGVYFLAASFMELRI